MEEKKSFWICFMRQERTQILLFCVGVALLLLGVKFTIVFHVLFHFLLFCVWLVFMIGFYFVLEKLFVGGQDGSSLVALSSYKRNPNYENKAILVKSIVTWICFIAGAGASMFWLVKILFPVDLLRRVEGYNFKLIVSILGFCGILKVLIGLYKAHKEYSQVKN